MKYIISLMFYLSLTSYFLNAQTCDSLSKKGSKFYFSTFLNEEDFNNTSSEDLDSIIFYNELLISGNSCKHFLPYYLENLIFLYYKKNDYSKAKLYANKLFSVNSLVTKKINEKIYQYDSLESIKFNSYKILGKIYLNENNEDSLNLIIEKIDSLKSKVCFCMTCMGKQNWFIKELQSDFYLKRKENNKALSLWVSTRIKGNNSINEKLIHILTLKYGLSIKEKILIKEVNIEKYSTSVVLMIKDEIIDEIVINLNECEDQIECCLGNISYLNKIF